MSAVRILFIAPSSYPIFGAEANVNAKILKTLVDGGCIVDLVCRDIRENHKCYPISTSDFFFKDVNSINLVAVNTAFDFKTILRHLKTFLKTGYVYKGIDWAFDAIITCEKLLRQYQYDFIYTYDYPSEVVGVYLSKRYGIKWVATWNDPYMWIKYPSPYGKGINAFISYFRKKLITDIGIHTFCNVFPSVRLRDYMFLYMSNMQKVNYLISPHIILENLVPNQVQIRKNGVLKILHAGALGRERNPEVLLNGLRLFVNQMPEAKIELTFLGVVERIHEQFLHDLIISLELNEHVKCFPPVPYMDSLDIMKEYDVCLILEAPCKEGIFLPSKVADYMQNKKVIWAISPSVGVLHDMYNSGIINYFSNVEDSKSVSTALIELYSDFKSEKLWQSKEVYTEFLSKNVFINHQKSILTK